MTGLEQLYEWYLRCTAVVTDTRKLQPGAMFFALRGERFDGNAFAAQALQAGCACAVVDNPAVATDSRCLLVADVLKAMQDLAALHRRKLGLPVLQVTGTNGKTTTKELLAATLKAKYAVHYTQGNLNNHIGVPLTLLQLKPEHELAIIETGANHPGEIAALSQIVAADCGVITNVGMAHLEGFGSFEGVVKTKSELYDALRLRQGGFVFLHGDDEVLRQQAVGLPSVTYGLPGKGNAIEGEVMACDPCLRFRWRRSGGGWQTVDTHLIGAYNLPNALCAVAAGVHFGVSDDDISASLASYQPTNQRSELVRTAHNTLIVDAYNANLTSMLAALDNFSRMEHPAKLAVLGEMRELGQWSAEAHLKVLQRLLTVGCKDVWLVGKGYAEALETLERETGGAGASDKNHSDEPCVRLFADVEAVKQTLREHPLKDRLILVKGSNGTRLYTLPECL